MFTKSWTSARSPVDLRCFFRPESTYYCTNMLSSAETRTKTQRVHPSSKDETFVIRHLLCLLLAALATLRADGAQAANERGTALFADYIQKIFETKCFECHSHAQGKAKGGLVLDSREGWAKGGDSGAAIKPGDVDASLLFKAISYSDCELKMPPKKQLSETEIERVREWIALGAPDSRKSALAASVAQAAGKGKDLWSLKPLKQSPVPVPRNAAWSRTDIDRFVLSGLERAGLRPSPDADPATWLRRVHIVLTGLLPEPEQVERFCRDTSEKAYERVVDELLASRHFGERWGRHWLDVARYCDVRGSLTGKPFREAWRYRDYVIDAFNSDKPFDAFVREQLAGDLMPADNPEQTAERLIATGFLSIGHWPGEASEAGDPDLTLLEIANEQISTVSTAFLSLSVGCARCHDHKFDPVPTTDYYALAGIFRSTWAVTFNYDGGPQSRYVGPNNVLLPITKDPRAFISAPATMWRDMLEEEVDAKQKKRRRTSGPTVSNCSTTAHWFPSGRMPHRWPWGRARQMRSATRRFASAPR